MRRSLLSLPLLGSLLLTLLLSGVIARAQEPIPSPRLVSTPLQEKKDDEPKKEERKFPFPKKKDDDKKDEPKKEETKKEETKKAVEEPKKEEPKKTEPKKLEEPPPLKLPKEEPKSEEKKEDKKEEKAPETAPPVDFAPDIKKAADAAAVADKKGDSAWMLVASALVMLMVPGLALFYCGMVRRKNVLATMMQSFAALAVVGVYWIAIGYALAFGPSVIKAPDFLVNLFGEAAKGGGLVGFSPDLVFLKGVKVDDYLPNTSIPVYLHVLFQGMFAIITPALISGAIAERIRFWPFCIFMILWVTVVYCPLAHMVWAIDWFSVAPEDPAKGLGFSAIGLLGKYGALDFAGGTVVHIAAGIAGLACCLVLRRRKGYPQQVMHPNSMVLTLLGAGLLWFGWFGFNGGSALNSTNLGVSAFGATQAAAAAAGFSWIVVEWLFKGKPTALGLASGIVAGLVAVTPASGYVEMWGGLAIGGIAGIVCYFSVQLKSIFKYDDSLDAFGVHAVGGFLGAVLTGVFCYASVQSASADGYFAVKGLKARLEYVSAELPKVKAEIPTLFKAVAETQPKFDALKKLKDALDGAKSAASDVEGNLLDTPGDADLKKKLDEANAAVASAEAAFKKEAGDDFDKLTADRGLPFFKWDAAKKQYASLSAEKESLEKKIKDYADEKTSRTAMTQPTIQLKASIFSTVFAFVGSFVLAILVQILTLGNFTTTAQEETAGLDQTEHGEVGFDFGVAGESLSTSATSEPRAAKVPPGSKRFDVVVDGIDNGGLMHAWTELCQPAQEGKPVDPDFKAIYPYVTTVQGNRFRFRGGDAKMLAAHIQRLFMKKLGKRDLKVRVEE